MKIYRLIPILFIILGFTNSDNIIKVLKGHKWSVVDIELNNDGDLLLSGGWDNTMKLWSLVDNKEIFTFSNHDNMIWDVAFSRDENYVASCSWDGSINVWEINSKKLINKLKHKLKFEKIQYEPYYDKKVIPNMCNTIDFSPDNKFIASGSSDGMIRIWDFHKGELLEVINIHDSLSVNQVLFTNSGNKLISTSNKVIIYNLKTKQIDKVLEGHREARICSMDLDKNEKFLLTGDIAIHNPLIIMWDITTGDSINVFRGHEKIIRDVCFSNSEKLFASVGEDNLIKVWDINSNKILKTMTDNDGKELTTICFNLDDRQIIYGSQDRTIKFRDITDIIN